MIEIIPAMDLIDGRCVRLTQGDFSRKTVYSDDPVDTAKRFEAAGLRRLHMVDLDGARRGKPANLGVLERVVAATSMIIDYGGGIKTASDAVAVYNAGASILTVGSIAVSDEEVMADLIRQYGGEKLLLGADSKHGFIRIDGWQSKTSIRLIEFLGKYAGRGIMNAFVTDISRDGAFTGPAVDLYREVVRELPGINLIASGGVTSMDDVEALEQAGCSGVIIGKAIYEKRITIGELASYAR